MKLAVPKEIWPGERRVAVTPDTVKKLIGLGFDVAIEAGAGINAAIPDDRFTDAGATIAKTMKTTVKDADVILKVRPPVVDGKTDELAAYKKGAAIIALLDPYDRKDLIEKMAAAGVSSFAMELMPRISRAQSMDVLSSQSNLAGYRAVLDAAHEFGRIYPMMMTAAGTLPPARVVIVGAGVAGLQAIATAKRLGAVVSAFDVRPAVKEQVQSLGGTFIEVEDDAADGETAGGYAKEMSDEYKAKQAAKLKEVLAKTDIVITTALIPGRPAPEIVTADMVAGMKPGSVIIDLAAERGGNVAGAKLGETVVTDNGVKIIGPENITSSVATDATAMYAKNLLNFITLSVDKEKGTLAFNAEDQIIAETMLTRDGKVVHPKFGGEEVANG
ncbi:MULTISPECIES: Re/Si-specific NAD(P)(+) transhydrogenase subunit alpha [Thalassospira]|jgi:NAD(P) transhydrogenase subunit alpha|uniref:proton-translocating NAD(P)(+) transhydrogenase n=1 Tax=Thalassospira xiamenensis TaxID=220697 RepID=A0ABR5Y266_9PROT|nr:MULTISPECIES: Re/Si-specific NAD(P)(+) transhydrogenase subunit alpha [Thalassospira]MBR9781358.1 Re/Si-specific NAD(P)(+) transhydrogenase subunit alpha [Rhodospirillales bacterium]KZD02802.1 NAD(P) transhydrogenase subunit alpha [Thalassospira xiamenensis]KZD10963.1 NAD(P) transhydrogenase subunit alpha [Thalassospira xiamenensis]MBR9818215.1 Re/Si-specific NAD(P)(+) transhydrogenase subunit alpha [Rhodospirillales bacterium]MCD1596095.1 Re/Si-specific NAD(P)(+) transhydrogenase subunit a